MNTPPEKSVYIYIYNYMAVVGSVAAIQEHVSCTLQRDESPQLPLTRAIPFVGLLQLRVCVG